MTIVCSRRESRRRSALCVATAIREDERTHRRELVHENVVTIRPSGGRHVGLVAEEEDDGGLRKGKETRQFSSSLSSETKRSGTDLNDSLRDELEVFHHSKVNSSSPVAVELGKFHQDVVVEISVEDSPEKRRRKIIRVSRLPKGTKIADEETHIAITGARDQTTFQRRR